MKYLIILINACLLSACIGGSSNHSEPVFSVHLNTHQEMFTTPSRVEISGSAENIVCTRATLDYPDTSVDIALSLSYWFPDINLKVCSLDNLPEDLDQATALRIEYEKGNGNTYSLSFNEPANNLISTDTTTLIPVNSKDKRFTTPESSSSPQDPFNLTSLDYSGGTMAMQYILSVKHGYEYSESEIMSLLLTYGETESIIERRGFSFLDMKRVFEHHGINAGGFKLTEPYFDGETLTELQSDTPFLMALNIFGYNAYTVVTEVSSTYFIFVHPALGYVKISIEDIENLEFTDDGFLIILISDIP